MKFPSLEFVKALQEQVNRDSDFNKSSRWSDVKVLLCLGEQRYWLKLYGGKVIDVLEYSPVSVPLGWDYMISGTLAAWEEFRAGRKVLGELINYGHIVMDGDMVQVNRMYEANFRIMLAVGQIK